MSFKLKRISEEKIPGTDIPDVTKAQADPSEKRWMSRVAVTTAILATFASLATMFATNHLNKAMIEEIKAADQWAFFQAKGIKLAVLESRLELLPALGKPIAPEDTARAERYKKEQEEISGDARAAHGRAANHRARQGRLSNGSTAFQIAIALCAVALLTRKNVFWMLALAGGAVGLVFFAMGLV
jgi:hypothetical protein